MIIKQFSLDTFSTSSNEKQNSNAFDINDFHSAGRIYP